MSNKRSQHGSMGLEAYTKKKQTNGAPNSVHKRTSTTKEEESRKHHRKD